MLALAFSLLIFGFIFAGIIVSRHVKSVTGSQRSAEGSGETVKAEAKEVAKANLPRVGLENRTVSKESARSLKIEKQARKGCLSGIELLSGFGLAHLDGKGAYHVIPFYVDLDFDLKPLLSKIGIHPVGLLQFVEEPFLAGVSNPKGNLEVGNNFLIKIGLLPETSRIQPYFKGGAGFLYMSQHTLEQGTQFNFNEYAGFGIHFFLNKSLAFTMEYRYRHLSNAGIKQPNHGINSNFGILGLSYLF